MKRDGFVVLTRKDVESLINLSGAIEAVENVFNEYQLGQATVFPVIREPVEPYGGFFGIKAGYLSKRGYLGYKGGGYWKNNQAQELAGHQSVILLYDPETGLPLTVMDGNFLTILRTGAVGAIAAKYLARQNSSKVAMIGTGTQGEIQLTALFQVLPIKEMRCYSRNQQNNQAFASRWTQFGLNARACSSVQEAIAGSDLVVTTTPSFESLVKVEWIKEGMHINAIGSDTKGKQELDPLILKRAKIVVDSVQQAKVLGECQHAFNGGLIDSVYAKLGEITSGAKRGRENEAEITIFDSTGIALQDLSVAAYVYEKALEHKLGMTVKIS